MLIFLEFPTYLGYPEALHFGRYIPMALVDFSKRLTSFDYSPSASGAVAYSSVSRQVGKFTLKLLPYRRI